MKKEIYSILFGFFFDKDGDVLGRPVGANLITHLSAKGI
jgi:hypothetical protein